mmetsp:Transcript_12277/g.24613  ORF Transcript_12277/g.24613 Transcript_12277/m.24613 type:complete len:519 (+) Transcript_12277:92-1648(+)|eukprot:CAMPEP_0113391566 /NCGR_PEP_ID=MMETSP0013_2-20120614/10787_1 /TAXON_ID=2843 ORGANISM="Skeletonema costatum, Strain 1716" /NCGR_SAMPLE_ID=MMETSP0013_2 /ASSEMBLY_ACC=CAM_ASM_000158 /LENGTH=518 /DNA_ID=CAMNT_0000274835 /DNA_START=63 /DNA_END=1619 /DNA_ORIENTATION=+ /assembly_acc=CAM_ASM_000158
MDNREERQRDYDQLARNVNLEDITSSQHNREVLRQLRDNDPELKSLIIESEEAEVGFEEDSWDLSAFVVKDGTDDIGWLGYFVGKSEVLQSLCIQYLPDGSIKEFIGWVNSNRSIQELSIEYDLGDTIFNDLIPMRIKNNILNRIEITGVNIGRERARRLALVLNQQCDQKAPLWLQLKRNNLDAEGLRELATLLTTKLGHLCIAENQIGMNGGEVLGAVIRSKAFSQLTGLDIGRNNIGNEGVQVLAAELSKCTNIKNLNLSGNRAITAVGLGVISGLLGAENCRIESIDLSNMHIGDDGAEVLAAGLVGNQFLMELIFGFGRGYVNDEYVSAGITDSGWSAFSKLLCNTSSINSTYMSNHTLAQICQHPLPPPYICKYLQLNAFQQHQNIDTAKIAKIKILLNHPDLDMEPFFQKQLKLLPHVMSWFQRARSCHSNSSPSGRVLTRTQSQKHVLSRELSAVYKFIRGMPMVAADGYCKYVLKTALKRKRKLQLMIQKAEEEEEWAQKRLKPEPEYD